MRIGNKETKNLLELLKTAAADAQDVATMKGAFLQLHRWMSEGTTPVITVDPFNDDRLNDMLLLLYEGIRDMKQREENECISCAWYNYNRICQKGHDTGKPCYEHKDDC